MQILLLAILVLAILVLCGLVFQAMGAALDRRRYPPPGRLLKIGAGRLHFLASGQGRPAVVFESGISASCLNWTLVRTEVARFTCACAYDRASLGWSDPATTPRLPSTMAGELDALLSAAHVLPPYVLVAHSFGALVVRAYASRFPDQVAGLVLVDPLPESAWLHPSESQIRMLRRGVTLARRGALLARIGVVRLALALLSRGARRLPKVIAKFTSGEGESVISRLVGEVQKMPPEVWPMVQAHWCLPKSFKGLANYLESLPASSAEASALSVSDSIPVATLTAGATGAGHWIHLDRPDLVIHTIQEMVTRNSGTDESVPNS